MTNAPKQDSPPPEPTPTPPPKEPTPPPPPPPKRAPSMPQANGVTPGGRPNMNYNNPNSYTPNPQAMNYALNAVGQSNRHVSNMSPAPVMRQNTGAQANGYGSAHTPSVPQQRPPYPQNTNHPNNQNYKAPATVEVYHLKDGPNSQIPSDIRSQF